MYRTEFPDYPIDAMPPIPEGFVDTSWHNDTCPSFTNAELGLVLFIDYPTEEWRELPGAKRFSLLDKAALDSGAICEPLAYGDDWRLVLVSIEAAMRTKATDYFIDGN